jgi:hypothetical protein
MATCGIFWNLLKVQLDFRFIFSGHAFQPVLLGETMTLRNCAPSYAVALAVLLTAAPQSNIHRDWVRYPAVVQIDTEEDIFAVGDVHSDYDRLVRLLIGARIIDALPAMPEKAHWAAGKSVVVFTGDIINKGPNVLGVLGIIRRLQDMAARAGGRVVVTMGNHEGEFLSHPEDDKSKDFTVALKAVGLNGKDVAACQGDLGQFLCSMPFAVRVNDWFFSHAGNSDGRTMKQLMEDLQHGVDKDGFNTSQLSNENSLILARLGERGPKGASWFEIDQPKRSAVELLAAYASALGTTHIVEGHHHDEVNFPDGARRKAGALYQWRGLLFLIDTGMSRGIGDSQGAVLHIRTKASQASAICPNGKTMPIWDRKRASKSGYAEPCGV